MMKHYVKTFISVILFSMAALSFNSCTSSGRIDSLLDKYEKLAREVEKGNVDKIEDLGKVIKKLEKVEDKMTVEQKSRLIEIIYGDVPSPDQFDNLSQYNTFLNEALKDAEEEIRDAYKDVVEEYNDAVEDAKEELMDALDGLR